MEEQDKKQSPIEQGSGAEVVDFRHYFPDMPDLAKPMQQVAERQLSYIERLLLSCPSLVNWAKALVPKREFRAVFTAKQKGQLAVGALQLLVGKNGKTQAMLVHPQTKRFVSKVDLEELDLGPEATRAVADYAAIRQMANIARQIQCVQSALGDVLEGMEQDRLATAYGCRQNLVQALGIGDETLRRAALLRLAFDAENSRNLLMQSQIANVRFVMNQPESFLQKWLNGASSAEINARIEAIRTELSSLNTVSLVEAVAYLELGEQEAAGQSLLYYAGHIRRVFLEDTKVVTRLDMVDPSPSNYWSTLMPRIVESIMQLPYVAHPALPEENKGETDGDR